MNKREWYFYIAFLIGGLLIGSGFTLLMVQQPKHDEFHQWYVIMGKLVDSNRDAISYQYIELWGLGFGAITASRTDVNGNFRLYADLTPKQMVNLVIRQNGRIYIGIGGTITVIDEYIYLGQVTFQNDTSFTINR